MPSFMKDELKKKDEQKLEEMQQEINAADSDEADEAEAASESAETEAENKDSQDEAAAQIEKLTAELKEKEDRVLRLQADFENFRRRTSKEKEELSAVVTQGMLKDMLPLLDNFERAMEHAQDSSDPKFAEGMQLILKQLQGVLEKTDIDEKITGAAKGFKQGQPLACVLLCTGTLHCSHHGHFETHDFYRYLGILDVAGTNLVFQVRGYLIDGAALNANSSKYGEIYRAVFADVEIHHASRLTTS